MPRCSVRDARGDDRPDSDIDIMVELSSLVTAVDLWGYVGITQYLADLFPPP